MAYRRPRGDTTEVYKFVHNIYDQNITGDLLIMMRKTYIIKRSLTLSHKQLYSAARVNFFASRVFKI